MPKRPTDPAIVKAHQRVVDLEAEGLVKLPKTLSATPEGLELAKHYSALASNAKKAANSAQMKVERLLADDTIPLPSRQRQAREALAAGHAEVARYQRSMDTTRLVIEAHLKSAALPKPVDPAREALAREEVRMRVAGSADPVLELIELAQGDGELAAIITHGEFAESLLRSQRVSPKESKEAVATIGKIAVESAQLSADPQRKAAIEALGRLDVGPATYYLTSRTLADAAEGALDLGISFNAERDTDTGKPMGGNGDGG